MAVLPKVSIITAVLNQAEPLEKTLASIRAQQYPAIESIVIDGGSTDGTQQILENASDIQWVSEPDSGISEAFNKGIKKATGDYLYFIGAGDYLWSADVVAQMMQGVDPQIHTLVCGRINRPEGSAMRTLPARFPCIFAPSSLRYKMSLPHQGLFTHRRFFQQYGLFDLQLKYAMDYELLLRAYQDFPPVLMKDIIVAAWLPGGVGAHSTLAVYREYRQIKAKHRIAPSWMLGAIHYWNTFKYLAHSALH